MYRTPKNVFQDILLNRRISNYASYLENAIIKGYILGGIHQFLSRPINSSYIILRHDVDIKDIGVREILDIEKKLGISSSWYFRWSTVNKNTIREIVDAGGEVGLHYETLANICIKYRLSKRTQVTPSIINEARDELKREIDKFRKEFDVPCLTIASHGHPLNTTIRMSNNEIINSEFCHKAGIKAEAYESKILNSIDCYISDTTPIINYGWAYNQSLDEAIIAGKSNICFLSHPNHWIFQPKEKIRLLLKLLIRGVTKQNKIFQPIFEI